ILPKSVLSIWPSSVVPTRSNVTLCCVTFEQNIICDIQREGNNLDPWIPQNLRKRPSKLHSSWGVPGWFDFYLTGLEESDTGYYTCVCYGQDDPDVPLQNSDAILLLVTGHLPKPSLQAHQRRRCVTVGGNVILQCKKPDNVTAYKMFLFLKEGVSSPVQVQRSERNRADFSLRDVTPEDTGNYSCVYLQIGAPFWASHPSDLLEILVSVYACDTRLSLPSESSTFGRVATGGKVNLQCQKSHNFTQYIVFVLLKEGTSSPIQLLNSKNDMVEFTLQNVTVHDAGRYSCVYLQAEAPFRTSHPSEHLDIAGA
ncbi:hypothetical protein U0070_025590, partial [Myodes glareolus]